MTTCAAVTAMCKRLWDPPTKFGFTEMARKENPSRHRRRSSHHPLPCILGYKPSSILLQRAPPALLGRALGSLVTTTPVILRRCHSAPPSAEENLCVKSSSAQQAKGDSLKRP